STRPANPSPTKPTASDQQPEGATTSPTPATTCSKYSTKHDKSSAPSITNLTARPPKQPSRRDHQARTGTHGSDSNSPPKTPPPATTSPAPGSWTPTATATSEP